MYVHSREPQYKSEDKKARILCCLHETHLTIKDIKKGVTTSRPREQAGVTVQYLKKYYKPKLVRKDNEG